ncbi:hypothetical protein [uncultured Ramlibacter sp.]|uniref:hypothetical protein n=1 Tax=uncultured Ramlibacter sp. TaxID=260755 RepID=UPI0026329A27|nr:hypothetical protein [uncultured Ramlibacter sp.]
MKIALLGAQSTGKTSLATALATPLRSRGQSVTVVTATMLCPEGELSAFALEQLHGYDAILLCGLDLPWVADGPQAREAVDALIRTALQRQDLAYRVVYGIGPQRLANALRAIDSIASEGQSAGGSSRFPDDSATWRHFCANCGDPQCERRIFSGRL